MPLRELVEARSNELGMSRSELARRCGYKNVPKGLRRLEELFSGQSDMASANAFLTALPNALGVDKEIIDSAVRESVDMLAKERRKVAAEQDAKRRASFKPEAFLIGTESRPSSIVLYGITGGASRWLRVPLDLSKPPITFAQQAIRFVRRHPLVPFFGATTGFLINYVPDWAVRFDLFGDPVEEFAETYSPGKVLIEIGTRETEPGNVARIIGLIQ